MTALPSLGSIRLITRLATCLAAIGRAGSACLRRARISPEPSRPLMQGELENDQKGVET